jgi:hypothetical protein
LTLQVHVVEGPVSTVLPAVTTLRNELEGQEEQPVVSGVPAPGVKKLARQPQLVAAVAPAALVVAS